jgi:hypothetical protein
MSMTHHNQTKKIVTWFLNLPLDESIDNKKHKVWILNPWLHEARPKIKKSSRMPFRRGKTAKPIKGMKSGKPSKRVRKSSKPKQNEQEKVELKNSP